MYTYDSRRAGPWTRGLRGAGIGTRGLMILDPRCGFEAVTHAVVSVQPSAGMIAQLTPAARQPGGAKLNYGGDVGLHVGRGAVWTIPPRTGWWKCQNRLVQVAGADKAAWLGPVMPR